jgi:hypothetical protein
MQLDKATNKYKWNEKVRYTMARGPASRAIPATPLKPGNGAVAQLTSHFARVGMPQIEINLTPNKPGHIEVDMRIGWMSLQLPEAAIVLPAGDTLKSFWDKKGPVSVRPEPVETEGAMPRFIFSRAHANKGAKESAKALIPVPSAANDSVDPAANSGLAGPAKEIA